MAGKENHHEVNRQSKTDLVLHEYLVYFNDINLKNTRYVKRIQKLRDARQRG